MTLAAALHIFAFTTVFWMVVICISQTRCLRKKDESFEKYWEKLEKELPHYKPHKIKVDIGYSAGMYQAIFNESVMK